VSMGVYGCARALVVVVVVVVAVFITIQC